MRAAALATVVVVTTAFAPTIGAAPTSTPVQLTWVVHPPVATDDLARRPLDLEVTAGGKTKTIKLQLQLGALDPYNQVVCKTTAYELDKDEVAKIAFYEGGAGGYAVRKKAGAYELIEWSLGDGACTNKKGEMTVCPTTKKRVRKLAIPANATLAEAIVEIDAKGKRTPFDCTPPN